VDNDDPAALSLMGMLNLRMAAAAARHSRSGSTGTSTREATSTCPRITRG
jgi:hypothetical protein